MKSINVKFTDAQKVAYDDARGGMTDAEYVRGLVAADYESKHENSHFPDDMAQRGGNRLRVCPKCGSYNVDEPYNEWLCMDCGYEITIDGVVNEL